MKAVPGLMLLCILQFAATQTVSAQQQFFPIGNDVNSMYEEYLNQKDVSFHTGIRPYMTKDVEKIISRDSVEKTLYFDGSRKDLIYRKIRKESLIKIDSPDYHFAVDPLFHLEAGREFDQKKNFYTNTRGFSFSGDIGKTVSFSSSFYENQAVFVNYLDNYIRLKKIVPGQGTYKFYKNGFDYAMANGYISYTPSKHFNFQLGHDKNFYGEGYRSLLLSDNAFNYPFLKITTSVWKIKYINLYAQFLDIRPAYNPADGYKKKYGTFHILDYEVCKRFSVGFFEAIIWQSSDSTGRRGNEWNYVNPIIFYRPVEYSLGSPDNAIMGMNLKLKLSNKSVLYGQLILDEFNLKEVRAGKGWYANKQGFQAGFKTYSMFGIRNLFLRTEVNYVRPFTYSHDDPVTNYGHNNQSLAHPLGSNFIESVSILNYRYKSFFAEFKFMYAMHGNDTLMYDPVSKKFVEMNYGNDLYKPYHTAASPYGNYLGNGLKTYLYYNNLRFVYMINPKTNLNIEFGITQRISKTKYSTEKTNFVYFGIRTSLTNLYYDF